MGMNMSVFSLLQLPLLCLHLQVNHMAEYSVLVINLLRRTLFGGRDVL